MIENTQGGFIYTLECVGVDGKTKWKEEFHNLLPNVGRDYIMGAAMNGTSQFTSWYIGLYENARNPVAADTMTTLLADAGETTDYGATRLTLTPGALSGGVWSNSGSPAEATFTASATIRGGFITSGSAVGSTTGLLLSAGLLSTAKTVAAGEILKVTAGWSLTSI